MDTTAGSQPPSMAELVRAISEEAPTPVVPAPQVFHLPRPHPLGRLLVVGAVVLILLMAVLLVTLTQHVQGLMSDIRTRDELRANPPLPALPASDRLLESTTFAIELAAHPTHHARLYAARARALVGAGRPAEAIEAFTLATRLSDAPLLAGDQVVLAEALMASGRLAEARTLLLVIDLTQLAQQERARSNNLLARLTMFELQTERRQARVVALP